MSVSNISRGPSQSGSVGYWIAQSQNGRGTASAALALALIECFGRLRLHRVEAATLVDNVASRRVLERNGFTLIGPAESYLNIAGLRGVLG